MAQLHSQSTGLTMQQRTMRQRRAKPTTLGFERKKNKKKKNRQPSAVMLIIFKWQLSSERNPFPVAVGIAGARPLAYSAD